MVDAGRVEATRRPIGSVVEYRSVSSLVRGTVIFLWVCSTASCASSTTAPATPAATTLMYGGTWSGTYTPTSCTASGFFDRVGWCSDYPPATPQTIGIPFTLNLTQTGTSVSGTFLYRSATFTIEPTSISSTGALTLVGPTDVLRGVDAVTQYTLHVTWVLTAPVQGTITQEATALNGDGQSTFGYTIVSATRTGP